MSRGAGYINVSCDECNFVEEVQLTDTAHGFDDRNVNDELEGMGWALTPEGDFCETCALEKGL